MLHNIFGRLFGACLIFAAIGFAQDRGTVRGFVTDSAGATVPGAVVTIKNINTGLKQTARTGTDGG